ncbi:DUF1800 domain-containing protein [Consotaella salsifontis]|uniref:Uncharacterized conserved protein, DUF1800 family n=1 Tax=Consotaella salsifontis TaxID=1365950 RepID=A0A1T4QU99_9HYPH|nr:DUF1800 domain-containing protein [Consotaella salsifontis]SKA07265.1 Uncharacterized conserved protein, DUF1800 family [Consotaella salsifontis]
MFRPSAALALSRFGLGARPGDLDALGDEPIRALLAALDGAEPASLANRLGPSDELFGQVQDDMRQRKEMRRDGADGGERQPNAQALIYRAELAARIERAMTVRTGFLERLVAFWANHFAVQASTSGAVRAMAGAFEREAIRPHVAGRFEDMLVAATRHPAMLLSLNNASSVGPDSRAGKRRSRGLNENHAREIMELHTVGVTAGYRQDDVIAFAKVLTGWTFGRDKSRPEFYGRFAFNRNAHEPGAQNVMGVAYRQAGEEQGLAVLSRLAASPATARHIAEKLVRHFVADVPPPSLVDLLARRFLQTQGDLRAVAETLVLAGLAWSEPVTKIRSPQEFLLAALRASQISVEAPFVQRALASLGQPLWDPPSPAGFKDETAVWLAPDAMTTRVEIAERIAARARVKDPREQAEAVLGDRLSRQTRQAIERAESPTQGMTLLMMSPEFQRR